MSNLDKNAKHILLGALIGGVIGACGLSILHASRKGKNSPLNRIGETIANVGDFVKNHIDEPSSILKDVDKRIQKNESSIADILEWTAAGIHLWKKFKKGD